MASALTQVFSLQLINQLNQRHTVLQASFIMDELIRWRIKTMTVQYVIITVMTCVFSYRPLPVSQHHRPPNTLHLDHRLSSHPTDDLVEMSNRDYH